MNKILSILALSRTLTVCYRFLSLLLLITLATSPFAMEQFQEEPISHELLTKRKRSLRELEQAAEAGDLKACRILATKYIKGKRVPKDLLKGFLLLHKAADNGDGIAQFLLGMLYLGGPEIDPTIPYDGPKALSYLHRAADQDTPGALFSLGQMYKNGFFEAVIPLNIPKDTQKAFEYFQKGSYLKDQFCLVCLGEMYMNGHDISQDLSKALQLFKLAADQKGNLREDALDYIKEIWDQIKTESK